ncbi:hypothetical protein [Streptomyces sp. NPDC127084]|uniref:hypothetical protein n=1 Tax=Streptomyces sp. NPDC127084 TaxID=3347133 RepID=UPI003648DA27
MSESHVAAVLSRHWKLAVLGAAGVATVAATTTIVAATHTGQPEARSAASAADGKGLPVGAGDGGASKEKGKGGEGKGNEGKGKGDEGGRGKGKGDDKNGDKYGHHDDADATHVECDPNALISALVDLNSDTGGVLVLAKDCTYTLTVNDGVNGLPEITQPITIHGNGATIQRAADTDQFRFFEVAAGGDLKLSHLTLTRGKSADGEDGGAIYVNPAGRLDLDHVTVTRNTVADIASDDGGGIYNAGIATVRNSEISRNSSDSGAAFFNIEGKAEIIKSKITGNVSGTAENGYAAVYNEDGTLALRKSLVSYNYGGSGGGVYSSGTTEVDASAIEYNHGYYGGGIYHENGSLVVGDSRVAYNTARGVEIFAGGGFYLEGPAVIENSKVYGNVAASGRGGGVYTNLADGESVSIRESKIVNNQAPGEEGAGGGIYTSDGDLLRLTDVKVTGNISDAPAGGVNNQGTVETYGKIKIIDNVPTNCEAAGTNPVPNCFG